MNYIHTNLKISLKVKFNYIYITNEVIKLNNEEEEVECINRDKKESDISVLLQLFLEISRNMLHQARAAYLK